MKNYNRFKLLVIICAVLFAAIKTPDVDAAIISSDYSWKLSTSLPGGAPTNTNGFYIYSTTLENTFGSTARKMSTTCSTYNNGANSIGQVDYATINVSIKNLNGTVIWTSETYYHMGTGTVNIPFSTYFTYGRYCTPTYSLIRYTSATADMKGSFRFYNV